MPKEQNVVIGISATIQPVDYSAGIFMYECLIANIHKGILFLNEITQERITYQSFLQYSCRLADSLTKYGLGSENILSVCCENCIECFIPVIAGLFAGIPICPTNFLYTQYELNHAFNLVKPVIVFCSVKNLNKMIDLKKKCPYIKEIIVINSDILIKGTWNLKQFIDTFSDYVDIYTYKPVTVDVENRIALVLFSSGTTGLPKGVMLTHKNLNYKNAVFRESWLIVNKQSQHVLGFLPHYHSFGLHVLVQSIMLGCTVVVLEKFDFELHLNCIKKYKITTLYLTPSILQMYAKSPLMEKYDLSHVEYALVGGAPLSELLRRTILQRVGIKSICQGYGFTETVLATTLVPVGLDRPRTCGQLIPYVTAVVKDLKTGRNLGPYENGELCFKGNVVMKGYYKDEAATKEAFTEDGYYKSGDIGHYDEEGFFYVEDRLKELIKYKGHQVCPAELEGVIISNPKIKAAAVIGIPDEAAGELPMAFVVKQIGANLTKQEVIDYVKEFVAPVKYLRGGVIFVEDIPVNQAGKILKRELKRRITFSYP